jgi:ABC-type uncharacterized transport system involved in gliding motility auxiliary subunit
MKWDRGEWARTIGSIGVALLIASYVRYTRQGALLTLGKVLLYAGGAFLLASLVLGFSGIIRFFSRRSSQLGTNTSLLSLGVIVILGLLNFAGFRHHKRFDLTTQKLYTLSDQTRQIVSGLQKDVTVVRFDKASDPALDDLMAEYKYLSPHFKFMNVDPDEKPEIVKQYGASRKGDVIAASGTRTEHLEAGPRGGITEQDVTSAILKVTREKLKTVCFITNHGEKSLTEQSGESFSLVDQELKRENYIVRPVDLASEGAIPPECDVVVIAGPTQALFSPEAAMVTKYLDGGGKVFLLLDPETDAKLDDLLAAWNISLGRNLVIDASGVGRFLGTGPTYPIVSDYGTSPITKDFGRTMSLFPNARTVTIADHAKSDPDITELLKTSARSFTIPGLKKGQTEIKYDPKTDTAGPLTLGVSASRKKGDASSRLVVIGNSEFATNQWIGQQRNGDLFFNAINWLAEDENLISIRPKAMTNRRVTLTQAQGTWFKWFDLFILPGVVILSGAYIWWKRR